MRLLLALVFLALVFGLAAGAAAQPTPCRVAPAGYDGPCYYGALPAFFDDFAYRSARTDGSTRDAPEGDLFGRNAWTLRAGTLQSRAWQRYNRSDLSFPGTITFGTPSVMRMSLPAGLEADAYRRSMLVFSPSVMKAGTYLWRVRLSEHEQGQELRHAVWVMSPTSYLFEPPDAEEPTRYRFWSELDFENESHPLGRGRAADLVSRMSISTHYGRVYTPDAVLRLYRTGPTPEAKGWGFLARNGPPTQTNMETAPLVNSWADRWLYLIVQVEEETQTVTYRMVPEDGTLDAVAARPVSTDAVSYPMSVMHLAFTVQWLRPEGVLRRPPHLEADWAYYTPAAVLPLEDALAQVAALRDGRLARVNTTGRDFPAPFTGGEPFPLHIDGPDRARCGMPAMWTVTVDRIGTYLTSYRYRVHGTGGTTGPWHEVANRTVSLTPHRKQTGIELEATAQDLWSPHGVVEGEHWSYPNPDNDTATTQRAVAFDCPSR